MKQSLMVAFVVSLIAGYGALPAPAAPADAQNGGGDRITKAQLDRASFCGIGRRHECSPKVAVARGLFQTGLRPQFAPGVKCRGIDEHWAISYTYKRNREAYHAGIDLPAPFGTPILAVASGTVVGVYNGKGHLGIHIILRHTPEDTGLPIYVYTLYGHLQHMPKLHVGDRVRMGDMLGPTGNSGLTRAHARRRGGRGGKGGKGGRGRGNHEGRRNPNNRGRGRHNNHGGVGGGVRRPAVHFGVYYSSKPQYAHLRGIVIPANGYWMDPVALFRAKPPFDSKSMRALPAADKRVPIPYLLSDGSAHAAGTKLAWPYACHR